MNALDSPPLTPPDDPLQHLYNPSTTTTNNVHNQQQLFVSRNAGTDADTFDDLGKNKDNNDYD